jgi:hypothetical protein
VQAVARRGGAGFAAAAATPSERLLRLAEQGQYEALVAQARPVQQPSMVTPEEREAALRAAAADTGQRARAAGRGKAAGGAGGATPAAAGRAVAG